jgi:hemerythrin-like domain-containing protein
VKPVSGSGQGLRLSAGFDEPLTLLGACHDRVRARLALLQRLQAHLAANSNDANARSAARDVRRYFNLAAPAHHEDEERHVVPVLQASGETEAIAAAAQLLKDHRRLRGLWQELDAVLARVEAGQSPPSLALWQLVHGFVELHEQHLALEDGRVFPCFARLVAAQGAQGAAHLEAMGREMAERRGVNAIDK